MVYIYRRPCVCEEWRIVGNFRPTKPITIATGRPQRAMTMRTRRRPAAAEAWDHPADIEAAHAAAEAAERAAASDVGWIDGV